MKFGEVEWNADPSGCYQNGDSIRVCDTRTDGIGLTTYMMNVAGAPDVTTIGHNAPYCSGWYSKNLVEDYRVELETRGYNDGYVFTVTDSVTS